MSKPTSIYEQKKRLEWLRSSISHWRKAETYYKMAKADLLDPNISKDNISKITRLVNKVKWFIEPELTNPESPNICHIKRVDLLLSNFIVEYQQIQEIQSLYVSCFEDTISQNIDLHDFF